MSVIVDMSQSGNAYARQFVDRASASLLDENDTWPAGLL
jgi:hypothetical protein